MKVAVFRAEADGRRTAALLAERGHEAILAPVIRIVPTGAPIDLGQADAVVFTSQHAVEALGARPDMPDAASPGSPPAGRAASALPCFCVGTRTAAAARRAGFTAVQTGPGDAEALATLITDRCPPGTRLLFLAGRDRKPDLETALTRHESRPTVIEAYAAEPITAWPPAVVAALTRCDAALHYSARSAALACTCCETSGLGASLHGWTHYCLSDDVAELVRERALPKVQIAPAPRESVMLALF